MDKDRQPGIKFDGIILVKEDFWRDYNVPEDVEVKVNFEAGHIKMTDGYSVELNVSLNLTDNEGKDSLRLNSTFVGFFSIVPGEENMDIEEYIKINSTALMFPYIREHISSITTKAGIRPVYLPPTNLLALLDKHTNK